MAAALTNVGDNSSRPNGISMNEFLEFLKITCQVNNSIANPDKGANDIDYNKLANNEMINSLLTLEDLEPKAGNGGPPGGGDSKPVEKKIDNKSRKKSMTTLGTSQPRKIKLDAADGNIHPVLGEKLDEVINEGILDSVLPFICPPPTAYLSGGHNLLSSKCKLQKARDVSPSPHFKSQPPITESEGKEILNEIPNISRSPRLSEPTVVKHKDSRSSRRKSMGQPYGTNDDRKTDRAEVIIHVCDEVKNTSKDFSCPQHLLVSKMGYFADVTAGQKLEDMDISVHCDIQIFDWLMKWVKREPSQHEQWPQLDATNVVPILVSASFLQMEPLLVDCLSFCHARLSDVVRASTNLSCLNDSIVTRLAAMFTNLELEMIKDKKERITPRLWTKMIQSLCEPEPQALRGHYFTLGGIFRCNRCGKYLTQSVSSYVNCVPANLRLNRWGQLVSQHTRDTTWQITNYVGSLFKELKSWRKVYWKLWGHCHFLYCCLCETHFPAYQMNWCQFHPEVPQFLGPISEGRIAGPAGRYPCCGQQAFRFETLPGPNGCQYREHSVVIETDRDRAILTLAQIAAEGNCLYECPPSKPSAYGNSEPRWSGMSLMPTKCRQGLLPPLYVEENHGRGIRRIKPTNTSYIDSSSETESSEATDGKSIQRQISTSSDGCESEPSSPRNYRAKAHRRRIKESGGRYWSGEMSARSNQDNQREFEERIMKQVIVMVGKKTGSDNHVQYNCHHNGGSYIKLEAEWREQVKQKNFNKQKVK